MGKIKGQLSKRVITHIAVCLPLKDGVYGLYFRDRLLLNLTPLGFQTMAGSEYGAYELLHPLTINQDDINQLSSTTDSLLLYVDGLSGEVVAEVKGEER